jgi:ADP-ribosylglycohydrolase
VKRWSKVLSHRTTRQRLDAARGALLGTFVGDALGMPYEGQTAEQIPLRVR